MNTPSHDLVRQLQPSDAASFHSALRDSIDALSYWMPWCSADYSLADAQASSQRVAATLGATLECEARNRLLFQGAPHHAFVYSLVPEDVRRWA